MKNKRFVFIAIIFFLIINTTYYWQGKIGTWAFPLYMILLIVYFILTVGLISQIYISVREKFKNKSRLSAIVILTIVLVLILIKPFGIIDFDKFEGENISVAEREGSANCMTTVTLKNNLAFKQRGVCFGVTEINGRYYLQNDTIYFQNVELRGGENEYFKFAVIRTSKLEKDGKQSSLILFRNLKDTVGIKLGITKNEFYNR